MHWASILENCWYQRGNELQLKSFQVTPNSEDNCPMQVQLAAKVQGYHLYAQNPPEYGRHGYGSHYVSNRTMCLPALGGMIGIGSTPTNAQAFDTDKQKVEQNA